MESLQINLLSSPNRLNLNVQNNFESYTGKYWNNYSTFKGFIYKINLNSILFTRKF